MSWSSDQNRQSRNSAEIATQRPSSQTRLDPVSGMSVAGVENQPVVWESVDEETFAMEQQLVSDTAVDIPDCSVQLLAADRMATVAQHLRMTAATDHKVGIATDSDLDQWPLLVQTAGTGTAVVNGMTMNEMMKQMEEQRIRAEDNRHSGVHCLDPDCRVAQSTDGSAAGASTNCTDRGNRESDPGHELTDWDTEMAVSATSADPEPSDQVHCPGVHNPVVRMWAGIPDNSDVHSSNASESRLVAPGFRAAVADPRTDRT